KERLNERDDIALAVGTGEINRIAEIASGETRLVIVARGWSVTVDCSGFILFRGAGGVDLLAARHCILLRRHSSQNRRPHEVGIGQIGSAISERDTLC